MWQDLKDRFSQGNGPRIFQLQKILTTLSQENFSVSEYFTKIKSIWDELDNYDPIPSCLCGGMWSVHEKHNQDHVFQFLMGLNDSFANIRGHILLNDPLPPINKVFSLIIQEERKRKSRLILWFMRLLHSWPKPMVLHCTNLVNGPIAMKCLFALIMESLTTRLTNAIGCMGFHMALSSQRINPLLIRWVRYKVLNSPQLHPHSCLSHLNNASSWWPLSSINLLLLWLLLIQ